MIESCIAAVFVVGGALLAAILWPDDWPETPRKKRKGPWKPLRRTKDKL